ncbi:hypothetical protein FRB96_006244 [Tulasnella sp. 330]|nr:hypothetical protein FRB96_006244 [Tulasnella sp. 330]KAG8881206.1 hypothetical protein FRB97_009775 [Tulasnella sp. 331]KAG8890566.1 hypothetical protein FRB98_007120 [Tulasnella sp. 332]
MAQNVLRGTPSRVNAAGTSTAPAPKSSRKRRRSADDEASGPTRSRTRSQVILEDDAYKKDIYLLFVRNALREKAKGNATDFDQLVARFSVNALKEQAASSSNTELLVWISALTHVVSGLERVHAPLVDALIALPWTTMHEDVAISYMNFLGMLVSARPEYLTGVLTKIVRGFTYQSGMKAIGGSDNKSGETSKDPMSRRLVYNRLHGLLQRLLSLIPTLSTTLEPLLVRTFPHKRQEKNAQVTYIRNILRVSSYCPELGDRILATVVDRAIQIDVEIQVELEDLDEDMLGDEVILHKDPFDTVLGQSDDGDDEEDSGGDALSDISSDAESASSQLGAQQKDVPTDLTHVTEMISKLDAILKLLFEHLDEIGSQSQPGSSDTDSIPPTPISHPHSPPPTLEEVHAIRRQKFLSLLTIFDRTIIRTFKSRYTQFLLFWYSSLDPEFADLFQGLLVSRALFEVEQPMVTRCAAASYIASLVSRARFVDRDSTRQVVGLLCQYLEGQLDELNVLIGGSGSGPVNVSGGQFAVFYAVAQAVFLIFCFRWRDLLSDQGVGSVEDETDDLFGVKKLGLGSTDGSRKWISELDVFPRLIPSPLNPLKVCSMNVVKQFAHIAQATGFVYCYGIIESNRRAEWSSAVSSPLATPTAGLKRPSFMLTTPSKVGIPAVILPSASDDGADLSSFFPFDPYKLPLSNTFVQGVYREWSEVALDEDDDDEDEDDDVDNVGDRDVLVDGELDAGLMSISFAHEEGIARSFEGMSISPIRQMGMGLIGS